MVASPVRSQVPFPAPRPSLRRVVGTHGRGFPGESNWKNSDLLTFSHVAVTGNRALLAGGLAGAASGETHQTDSVSQVGLPVQLQQSDVVVQRLAVVVVVYVSGGHAQSLRARRAELLR